MGQLTALTQLEIVDGTTALQIGMKRWSKDVALNKKNQEIKYKLIVQLTESFTANG